MLYAVLCYNDERMVGAWSKEEDAAVMSRLEEVHQKYARAGKFTGAARLTPTTAAVSMRKGDEPMILDGPFVETKEQLLGFYVVDVEDLEEALGFARELTKANPGAGGYEVRPVALFRPGKGLE